MLIYPAIDIKDGKCVRLFKGDYNKVTVFNENPIEVARGFEQAGASYVHVVDLDGARAAQGENRNIICSIAKALSVPVQTGGGIRSLDTVEKYISQGISRVILGTAAIKDEDFLKLAVKEYGDKIAVGIDAKNGLAAYDGWEKISDKSAVTFALELENLGVKHIIYTDIDTDGTLAGPNFGAMREMAQSVNIDIIASGGVSCIEDVKKLSQCFVGGVIIGKAIYTGKIDLKEAIRLQEE